MVRSRRWLVVFVFLASLLLTLLGIGLLTILPWDHIDEQGVVHDHVGVVFFSLLVLYSGVSATVVTTVLMITMVSRRS